VGHTARRAAILASALSALALPAVAGAAPIQPGAYHETDAGACTLNFIYDGGGKVYAGTAAHCVSAIGQDVRDEDGVVFGDVAFIGDEDATETDYAFIEIRASALSRVSPAVKGWPSYPTGATTSSQTAVGDQVVSSGYGLVFSLLALTREQRPALLTFDDAEIQTVLGALIFGDSGGPLIHKPTGRALGIVSRLCIGLCEEEGPTVEGLLAKAAARGFSVTLRTV